MVKVAYYLYQVAGYFFWRRIGMIKPPVTLGVSKFSYSKKKNLS
nr:MAG TPA: hypothetical protein [Caudoviricetes sp.]